MKIQGLVQNNFIFNSQKLETIQMSKTSEWINKWLYSHTMEYDSSIKRNETLIYTATCKNKTKQNKKKWPAAGCSLPTYVLEFKCRDNLLPSTPYSTPSTGRHSLNVWQTEMLKDRPLFFKSIAMCQQPSDISSLPSWFTPSAGAVLKAIQCVSHWLTHVNHLFRKYLLCTCFVSGNSPGDWARAVNKAGKLRTCIVWQRLMYSQLHGMSASDSGGSNWHYSVNQHSPPFFLNIFFRPFVIGTISALKLSKAVPPSSHYWLCQGPVPGLLLWWLSSGYKRER